MLRLNLVKMYVFVILAFTATVLLLKNSNCSPPVDVILPSLLPDKLVLRKTALKNVAKLLCPTTSQELGLG